MVPKRIGAKKEKIWCRSRQIHFGKKMFLKNGFELREELKEEFKDELNDELKEQLKKQLKLSVHKPNKKVMDKKKKERNRCLARTLLRERLELSA
jgi:hypothetical protein